MKNCETFRDTSNLCCSIVVRGLHTSTTYFAYKTDAYKNSVGRVFQFRVSFQFEMNSKAIILFTCLVSIAFGEFFIFQLINFIELFF